MWKKKKKKKKVGPGRHSLSVSQSVGRECSSSVCVCRVWEHHRFFLPTFPACKDSGVLGTNAGFIGGHTSSYGMKKF